MEQIKNKSYLSFSVTELLQWIKKKDFNKILWLYNGPDMGFENEEKINYWLMKKVIDFGDYNDYDESYFDFFSDITSYFEKNYAFFRDLMGTISDDDIIEIGKYMIQHNIDDIRNFEEKDIQHLSNKLGLDEDYLNGDYNFYIPEVKDELNYHRGSDITLIGGGEYECLLEIELLMKMLEIPYKTENNYVY